MNKWYIYNPESVQEDEMHKYLDLTKELKKTMEHKGDSDTNCNWCNWNNPQRIGKGSGRHGNLRTRPSRLQHYEDWPEYWEESWILEDTCCHSNSSE